VANFEYINVDDVTAELGIGSGTQFTPDHDALLTGMIEQASRFIDRYKGVEDGSYKTGDYSADETRYYFGSGIERQDIDYTTTLTTVKVEETDGTYTTWTADTDFFAWPYNASQINEPIRRLDVNDKSGTTKSVWTFGPKRVEITGKFGVSSTVPDEVARACIIQVSRWFKRATQGWADSGANPDLGRLTFVKGLDPDVKTLLKKTFPRVGRGSV
jgi:hypothetical protein